MFCSRFWLAGLAVALAVAAAPAQVVYPAPPEKYDAYFRYRIRADRDERIRQYREMERFLKGLGFVQAEKEDADLEVFDPTAENKVGTIAAANGPKLLNDPRIQTVILMPAGTPLPEDGKKPVQVRLHLASGLGLRDQKLLHDQAADQLRLFGFREALAYDHHGYTFLRGSLPSENVLKLQKDLRGQPAGWFLPVVPVEQVPSALRATLPIRLVEVLADLPADLPPAASAQGSAKLTPDARIYLDDAKALVAPTRAELILEETPTATTWPSLRSRIRGSAEGLTVEGRLGAVVSVRVARGADLERLAFLPEVRTIRLPRAGYGAASAGPAEAKAPTPAEWLAGSNTNQLHAKGYRGQGARVVVIAPDFNFAALPTSLSNAVVIDMTSELDPELKPAPAAGTFGVGVVSAAMAKLAAPDASVVLVRVDSTALHQIATVARAAAGESSYSEALTTRSGELVYRADSLTGRRSTVTEEYRKAFSDLSDEEKADTRRKNAREALEKLVADEKAFMETTERFGVLKAKLDALRGSAVVVNTLVWDAGYPQDGLSDISRLIDEKFGPQAAPESLRAARSRPNVPIWIQTAGNTVGQVWAGPYRDADGNGVMEFTAATKLPAKVWTPELNVLGFAGADGKTAVTLPAGYKLRITAQWREALDLDGGSSGESTEPLTLRLIRQHDPTGKTLATDEFAEVGHSMGEPVRVLRTIGSAAFEQTLEVTIPADGVYSLRLERRSVSVSAVVDLRPKIELYPRIVLQAADVASAARGRVVFSTFPATAVGVGTPADADTAIAVGILGPDGQPTGSNTAAGPGVQLRTKPEILAPGVAPSGWFGPAIPAGFAAGVAASLSTAGIRVGNLATVGIAPGSPLVLPSDFLSHLPTKSSGR